MSSIENPEREAVHQELQRVFSELDLFKPQSASPSQLEEGVRNHLAAEGSQLLSMQPTAEEVLTCLKERVRSKADQVMVLNVMADFFEDRAKKALVGSGSHLATAEGYRREARSVTFDILHEVGSHHWNI